LPGVCGNTIDTRSLDVFEGHNFTQHVQLATHISSVVLDLDATSVGKHCVTNIVSRDIGISDHYLVQFHLTVKTIIPQHVRLRIQRLSTIDEKAFNDRLSSIMVHQDALPGAEEYSWKLRESRTQTLLVLAPPREIMVRQSFNGNFAIIKEAEHAKSYRRHREAILRKTSCQDDRVCYHRACRRAAMLINMSLNQHMADKIDEVDGDASRQWRVVNSFLHPVVIPPFLPVDWASTLSEYFNNKFTKIHEEV